jgi:hypothetical protein
MSKFEIGEIVIGQHFVHSTCLNGVELEVVRGLESRLIEFINRVPCVPQTLIGYGIRHPAGYITHIEPYYLRKKKPPKEIDWVKMCKLNQIGEIA